MRKRIIGAVIALTAVVSCQREIDFQEVAGSFTATTESTATRTVLGQSGETYEVLWQAGDEITVLDATGKTGVYTTQSTTRQGVFTFKSGKDADKPVYKAYYPATLYNDGNLALPAVQAYAEGNIHTAPMYAESNTNAFAFKNLCGIVRLMVSTTKEGMKVKKIALKADKGLSGSFTIQDDAAVISYGRNGISLECGEEGVAIGPEAVPFFIAVPAGTYTPLKITVITTDGDFQTRTSSTDIVITRSKVSTITLSFNEPESATGSADTYDGSQPWVQLWPGGPRWAKFNVGSTITSYAGMTEYTAPEVIGGYYAFKGTENAVHASQATDDTASAHWGDNWATPTMTQFMELHGHCDITYCDGQNVQFEPGCTLAGMKFSGQDDGYAENAIFFPFTGVINKNSSTTSYLGTRGYYWSSETGFYGSNWGGKYIAEEAEGYLSGFLDVLTCCSVRAICVGDEPYVEGEFKVTATNFNRVMPRFNQYEGENPRLIVQEMIMNDFYITRPDGDIDLNGNMVYMIHFQNNEPGKTVTVRNGTVTDGIDGAKTQGSYFAGTVALKDVISLKALRNDGHDYIIDGGTYPEIQVRRNASTPGTITIQDGCFDSIYRYVDQYGGADDGSAFILYGGKYKTRPAYRWCAEGLYVAANTDADAETYPFQVVEGDPSANWFTGPATDLSADATANTYMVHAAGTYKFRATVKGNGGRDPLTGTTATPIDKAEISGATVLWELDKAGRAICYDNEMYQIGYRDGYVFFNTPETFSSGDAYVAVFKDGEGGKAGYYDKDVDEVLWSWLIWAGEEPEEVVCVSEDLAVMDRNLGAQGVGSVPYRGCAYEWGRKDPFPGCYNGSYTPSGYYPARMTAFSIVDIKEGMTVAYSVAHPTTYPYGWSARHWQTADEFTAGMWWDGEKTIYDPSPAGWKVPSKEEMDIVRQSGANLPGGGFLGNCRSDFEYGNPGSCYYWTSTGVDRNHAWAWYGGSSFRTDHVDNYIRSGYTLRPVRKLNTPRVDPVPGSANTFLLTEGGTFSFDATVKGNGALDPMTGERATRIDKASIAGVKVLWEVYEAGRAIKHDESGYAVSYADGKVSLTTPDTFTSGAACIAVYDASETILWSWIIWTSPEPGIKEHNGKQFMDRNLGAVDAGNCMRGFLFEWGRKDGFSAADGNNYRVYPYAPEARDIFTHEDGPKSIAESVAHPTVWYRGAGTYDYSWMPLSDFSMKPWRNRGKTIYDPCPEGWRIPKSEELRSISGMPATGIGGGYDPNEYYKGFGNPGTGYYWSSSTDMGNDMRAYAFVNDGRNIQHWGQDQGYAIRCVKEE